MVGIIGRSGAGKSTLLRLINRLIEPTEGRILLDGTDITALRGKELRAWRARTAMIFQQFNLVNRLDVLTNVLCGRPLRDAGPARPAEIVHRHERALAIRALDRLGHGGRRHEPRRRPLRRPAATRRHRPGADAAASDRACG